MFALFDLKNVKKDDLMYYLGYNSAFERPSCLDDLNKLTVKKNLGSEIKNVTFSDKSSAPGYSILFGEGDICDDFMLTPFSSQIDFVCDPSF
jgi:hypothetical protein